MATPLPTRAKYNALKEECDDQGKYIEYLRVIIHRLERTITQLNQRSEDYLTIYRLLIKHHPPPREEIICLKKKP